MTTNFEINIFKAHKKLVFTEYISNLKGNIKFHNAIIENEHCICLLSLISLIDRKVNSRDFEKNLKLVKYIYTNFKEKFEEENYLKFEKFLFQHI